MDTSDIQRKPLNKRQTELREIMTARDKLDLAIRLFLIQHAALHSSKVSSSDRWSFEDAILNNISEVEFRHISKNFEHSIAWLRIQ